METEDAKPEGMPGVQEPVLGYQTAGGKSLMRGSKKEKVLCPGCEQMVPVGPDGKPVKHLRTRSEYCDGKAKDVKTEN